MLGKHVHSTQISIFLSYFLRVFFLSFMIFWGLGGSFCGGGYLHGYRRYHTITDVYTTVLLLTKPSSDDDSGFRHNFGAEASLPLTQSAPAVSHDTTKHCQIFVALWDCQIHADAVRALSWIFSMYFLLSDGGSPRLVKKTEGELAIKPLHPTSIGNTFVVQSFICYHVCLSNTNNLSLVIQSQVFLFFTRAQLFSFT